MLITCNGCGSKIRVNDAAAGKRVKCPKCATILRVPDAEPPEETPSSAVSKSPRHTPGPPPEPDPEPDAFSSVPPPRPSRSRENDDDEDSAPTRDRRSRYDDDYDDDDDDDDLDVRRRGRRKASNGMALTGMIMGIVSVSSLVAPICCCGLVGCGIIATATGAIALTFGIMGKVPGSESQAMTGIICGSIAVVLGIGEIILGALIVGVHAFGAGF